MLICLYLYTLQYSLIYIHIQVLKVLRSKGFQPHLNAPLLQKIIAWHHFDQFLLRYPDFRENLIGPPEEKDLWNGIPGESSGVVLDAYFRQWVKKVLERGVDGSIFLEMLEDRGLSVVALHSLFAQQIINKELGNGASTFLDFHVACEEGYIEVVRVFCVSGVDVEEAVVGRRTKESFRPLTMAAMEGHIGVVRVLLEFKANVRQLDNRGRSALHSAASKGNTAICELLLDHKAELFAPDFHGNNPIHLSVIGNHMLTLNVLAKQGLENYRAVSADAILVQSGGSFSKLVDEIYYQLQDQLLLQSETRRFEKAWLDQAAVLLLAAMDPEIRPLLAVPGCNPQIFSDVLSRFDPRPETGVFKNVKSKRAGQYSSKLFVPTIDTSRDLCILLKECFRQAVLDSVNNMQRTCFHIACDLNQIASHEEIIASLVNVFGVNVRLLDRHGNKGIDLLVVNKPQGHGLIPSASALREEVLIEDREVILVKVSQDKKDMEKISDAQRRSDLLEDCCKRSQAMNSKMWEACRAASMPWVAAGSISKNSKIGDWKRYIDPDTLNIFYHRNLKIDELDSSACPLNYQRRVPEDIKTLSERILAFRYQRRILSKHLRFLGIGRWQMLKCIVTGIEYYYDEAKDELRFSIPTDATWAVLIKTGVKEKVLGYNEEWFRYKDRDDNIFYHNKVTNENRWNKPLEAVEITIAETHCTAFQNKSEINQLWYTCTQCNNAWDEHPHEEGKKGT